MTKFKLANKNLNAAFTMMEMIFVVFILSVAATIATPMILDPIEKNKKNSFAEQLKRDIIFAKDYAYLTGKHIVMCASSLASDTALCDTSNNWNTGWVIYSRNPPGVKAGQENIVLLKSAHPASSLEDRAVEFASGLDIININSYGFIETPGSLSKLTIKICDSALDNSDEEIQLEIEPSGYIKEIRGASLCTT